MLKFILKQYWKNIEVCLYIDCITIIVTLNYEGYQTDILTMPQGEYIRLRYTDGMTLWSPDALPVFADHCIICAGPELPGVRVKLTCVAGP